MGATLAVLLSAGALGAGPVSASSGLSVVNAVGAENQYASVIAQIGGRFVHVGAVMSNPATDPHTYEASTGVAQMIAGAQLIVQNGVGYDTFMSQLESASPNPRRQVIVVQKLLGLALATANPHLWYKPSTMPAVAAKIEADLAKLSPGHASYFARRLAAFRASLVPVTRAIATFRAKFAGVKIATTEPVADYLLTALGLVNLTPFRFQADVMNGVDPSPEDIALQQNLFTHHRVRMLCYNAQVSSTVTIALRTLAGQSKIPVVSFYETMPTPGYDFPSWMLAEIAALTRALTTGASTRSLP
ncbi:MAG: metal ABC transporter solute-binding protein, Zn/Mn family [Acidimicrobiales bacterium]